MDYRVLRSGVANDHADQTGLHTSRAGSGHHCGVEVLTGEYFTCQCSLELGRQRTEEFASRPRVEDQDVAGRTLHDTMSLLIMPTLTRGRHRFTSHGQKLPMEYVSPVKHLQLQIVSTIRQLHDQVEVLKACGMPANEASRINQYHWLLQARIEKLQNVKFYRTPQATRSFTRLFILVLPLFYGPYYVYIARGNEYQTTNFAFCLLLSVSTSLLMTGIFNVERTMEDPFAGGGMDGVHVHEVFQLTQQMLDECYTKERAVFEERALK